MADPQAASANAARAATRPGRLAQRIRHRTQPRRHKRQYPMYIGIGTLVLIVLIVLLVLFLRRL
jgi:Tfp pilus assembly protein PilN